MKKTRFLRKSYEKKQPESRKVKTYLLINDSKLNSPKLTGAHRRFIELVKSLCEDNKVILGTEHIDQLDGYPNISYLRYKTTEINFLPAHINGMISLLRTLPLRLEYDYAISFGPADTCCFWLKRYRKVVSLFREDLIGYQKSLGASKRKLRYFTIQERIAVKASDLVIVQCKSDKDSLIKRTEKYVTNVQNKITIQINNANASWMKCNYFRDFNKEIVVPRILFIGDFTNPRKGHGILFLAMKKLRDEGYKFELLIAGDGADFDRYKSEYANDSSFVFLGRVSNMPKYLEISDFMLVPSLIDSCPNTVLEGLNAGIAVYGANAGGIPDLLMNEKYLFEPDEYSIYCFVKKVLDGKLYITDQKEQKIRKEALTFNWGKAVIQLMNERMI